MLRLTDRAREALAAADGAARRFNPEARVRLRRAAGTLVSDLIDDPGPNESLLVIDGIEVVVEDGLDGTVDAGEHNVLTIVP
jgi:plasmid stabilization system protein ParE